MAYDQIGYNNNHKHSLWQIGEMLWKDLKLCQLYKMADIQPFLPFKKMATIFS
jgi:hypothetical protein